MAPMPHKSAFQPKDPRIINLYEDDDDEDELDDWSLTTTSDVTPRPRRRKTGTQALVEFLNNTSPEEFQKDTPKRSSNLFFRRRKNKPPRHPQSTTSSTTSAATLPPYRRIDAPNTIQRKNYVEIIPNAIVQREPSTSTRNTSRTPSITSNSVVRRSVISNSDQQQQQQQQSPILPTNKLSKKRESSLYSDSLRHSLSIKSYGSNNYASLRGRPLMRQDTDVTLATKMSGPLARRSSEHTSGGSNVTYQQMLSFASAEQEIYEQPQQQEQQQQEEREMKATEALINSLHDVDAVEAALMQRLERFRLAKMEIPSDVVAAGLAAEHVRALQVSTVEQQELDLPGFEQNPDKKNKKRVRHIQVQTMPYDPPTTGQETTQVEHECAKCKDKPDHPPNGDQEALIQQLEQQLAQEKAERKRLQATLDETCDHFEVLSGLAYKKLRELWEEKTHWEHACIEMRDRLLDASQQQPLDGPIDDGLSEFPNSDYIVEEEEKGKQ